MSATAAYEASCYFYYFAYGSNLLRERIAINSPTAVLLTTAKLEGYRLIFGGHDSSRWGGHVANIARVSPIADATSSSSSSPPSHVWGTVWKIHKDNLAALDEQESVGSGLYEPISVETEPTHKSLGDKICCRTYQLVDPGSPALPSRLYKSVITAGARQNNLPRDYISFLEATLDNGFEGDPRTEWLAPVFEAIDKYNS